MFREDKNGIRVCFFHRRATDVKKPIQDICLLNQLLAAIHQQQEFSLNYQTLWETLNPTKLLFLDTQEPVPGQALRYKQLSIFGLFCKTPKLIRARRHIRVNACTDSYNVWAQRHLSLVRFGHSCPSQAISSQPGLSNAKKELVMNIYKILFYKIVKKYDFYKTQFFSLVQSFISALPQCLPIYLDSGEYSLPIKVKGKQ